MIGLPQLAMFALGTGKAIFEGAMSGEAGRAEAQQAMTQAGYKAGRALESNALATRLEIEDAYFGAGRAREAAAFYGTRTAAANLDAADQAKSNTELMLRMTALEENRMRDSADRVMASQTAYFAGSGIDVSTGSPVMLAALSAAQAETDITLLRANGYAQASGVAAQRLSYAQRADDAVAEALFRIDDANIGADRTADRALLTQRVRNDDVMGELGWSLFAARKRASNASASAMIKTVGGVFSAAMNAFGAPGLPTGGAKPGGA